MKIKNILAVALAFFMGIGIATLLEYPSVAKPILTPAAAATLLPIQLHQEKAICPSPATSRPSYYYLGGPDVVRYECLWDPEYFCPPGFSFAQGGPRDYGFLNVPGNVAGIKWTCQQIKVARI